MTDDSQGLQNLAVLPVRATIDNLLKLTALGGAIIYGALFNGYRTYYYYLGIKPEDVGISNAFILVRSIGFIFLVAVIAAIIFALTVLYESGYPGFFSRRGILNMVVLLAISAVCAIYLRALLPPSWPPSLQKTISYGVLFTGVLLGRLTEYLRSRPDRFERVRSIRVLGLILIVLLLAVVFPTVAINDRAKSLAADALSGDPISPYAILGVPVLDVSSAKVTATWICPDDQRPAVFKNVQANTVDGMLLGETGNNYFIRLPGKELRLPDNTGSGTAEIIKLPQNCVMVMRSGYYGWYERR